MTFNFYKKRIVVYTERMFSETVMTTGKIMILFNTTILASRESVYEANTIQSLNLNISGLSHDSKVNIDMGCPLPLMKNSILFDRK